MSQLRISLAIRLFMLAPVSPAALAVLVGCCFCPWYTPGLITFESYRYGNGEIYVMNPEGSRQVKLTNHPAYDGEAHGSRNGERIVFSSDRVGDEDIWVMDADGSGVTRLTDSPGENWEPAIFGDGERIAFISNRDSPSDVYVMNFDGSSPQHLTNTPKRSGSLPGPAITPAAGVRRSSPCPSAGRRAPMLRAARRTG